MTLQRSNRRRARGHLWAIIARTVALPLAALLLPMNLMAQSGDTWLLVDTQALTLTVMRGEAW